MEIEHAHSGGDELRQRVLREGGHRPRPQVRDRADVEHGPAACELPHEAEILDGADPVPQPVGAERFECASDRRRAGDLAGMGHRREPLGPRELERRLVRLGRILGLQAAEPDADDATVAVLRRVADDRLRLLEREAADDVGRQPDLDARTVRAPPARRRSSR